ncbi:MAG TPA: hypothetical protein VE093_30560 [Polyangiaceae bacterium]|nr:hypothetical protein [Polyangiaceae bacterium]
MDEGLNELMIQSDMQVAEPTMEDDGGTQAYSYFTGTCGHVCTSLTHFACCFG